MTKQRRQNSPNGAIPAYILAGGNSRRFGSDKARAVFQGQPLIRALSDQFIALGFTVTVVGKHDGQYADLGLDTIGDIEPGKGPIGGLRTALTHRVSGWILLCSCDMLGIDQAWVTALNDRRLHEPEADAIVARGDIWQPFPAHYHTRLLGCQAMRDARSFQSLLNAASVGVLRLDGLPPVRQANTPDELSMGQGSDR